MDAFKALAGQAGCSADGTAAQRNPLSNLVHQSMGGPQGQAAAQMGPRGMPGMGMQANEVDQGFAQGMGVMQGPRGPMMQGPAMQGGFVAEFEQMRAAQQGQGPRGPVMRGPMARGPGPAGQEQWINDFERMKMGGMAPGPNIHMEAAYRETMRRQQNMGPRPMGQRWAGQMAARPPPSQMDRAWQKHGQAPPKAQEWAQEMNGPKEAPDAEKWAQEANAKEQVR